MQLVQVRDVRAGECDGEVHVRWMPEGFVLRCQLSYKVGDDAPPGLLCLWELRLNCLSRDWEEGEHKAKCSTKELTRRT